MHFLYKPSSIVFQSSIIKMLPLKSLVFFALSCISLSAAAQVMVPVNLQIGSIITLNSGAVPSAVAVADYNQDFRQDIAVCQRGLNSVSIYLQGAGGSFSASPVASYTTGTSPTGLVAIPLGRSPGRASTDLVAVSGPSSLYTLLTNNINGSGTFTPVVTSGNFFGASNTSVNPQLITRDLDGNGWADFIYSHDDPSVPVTSGVYWQRLSTSTNVATGFASYFRPGYRPSSFALDDFDRDGTQDLVITSLTSNEFTVVPATLIGGGPDWRFANLSVRLPSGGTRPVHVATGDVNRDLLPDIAIAHEGSAEITLFLNLRNNQFGAQASYTLSAAPRKVVLRDLNGDGGPEMIVITADNRLQVFQHTGAAGITRYGSPITLATGSDPVVLELTDIDGDFVQDIVVGCVGDNTVRVYLNRSLALATRGAKLFGIDVFPNPAISQLNVQQSATSLGPLTAVLMDGLGRTIRSVKFSTRTGSIPVEDLPRGIYWLHLATSAGTSTQRVVLQ